MFLVLKKLLQQHLTTFKILIMTFEVKITHFQEGFEQRANISHDSKL